MARRFVIDANATLGLLLRLPYSQDIDNHMKNWQEEEAELMVPTLWEYECLTGLRRAVAMQLLSSEEANILIGALFGLEFHRISPTLELHQTAMAWSERIGQAKVYDAQYIALAEILSAEFYTADKRLFHSLKSLGVEWVHLIGSLKDENSNGI
jgi:predicted nucleic acid-binding protein